MGHEIVVAFARERDLPVRLLVDFPITLLRICTTALNTFPTRRRLVQDHSSTLNVLTVVLDFEKDIIDLFLGENAETRSRC